MATLPLLAVLVLLPAEVKVPAAVKKTEEHQRSLYQEMAPAVVHIAAMHGDGSGFLISADGLILTNRHVVGKSPEVEISLYDGRTVKGKVVERARDEVDLALVRIEVTKAPFLPVVGGARPEPGSFVASVGHGAGAVWSFNVGMVSNVYHGKGNKRVMQTQIPLNPGNSGGPVVDAAGRVVAVVTAGIKDASSLNFAIPIERAPEVLEGVARSCACVRMRASPDAQLFVDGKLVGVGEHHAFLPDGREHELMAVCQGKMRKAKVKGDQARDVDLR